MSSRPHYFYFQEMMNDDNRPFNIVISGPIAAGKTSLLRLWQKQVDCNVYEEPVVDNPYLKDLYTDPHRWSFEMQLFMLNSRLEAQKDSDCMIQDRCHFEDAIFASVQIKMGFMDKRSAQTYSDHLAMVNRRMKPFDLVVYLDISAKESMRRIKKRGRECEQDIKQEYLDMLHTEYQEWVWFIEKQVPVIRVSPEQIYVTNGHYDKREEKARALWSRVQECLEKLDPRSPRFLTPPVSPDLVPSVPTKIVVVGPLAAGKTTIVETWEKITGYSIHKEPVSDNPYLEDYYNDQYRWSFETQIYLLDKRLEAQNTVDTCDRTIQDRSYLDDEVFAQTQVAMGYMDQRALDNYNKYLWNMKRRMNRPHLILYVSISPEESMKRIKERNRACESDIPQDYLDELGKQYEKWIERTARTIPVFKISGKTLRVEAQSEQEKEVKIIAVNKKLWEKVCEKFEEEKPENGMFEI
jgi:deoxyadenosine kinase